jgi:F0F1-type ATP synthase membrane subunit c/vacuolar-type H+-ATPase subunit K
VRQEGPDTGGSKNKKRCRSEEYVDANGVTPTRNRCAAGFLLGGAGLGVGGTAVLGGLAIGAVAMAASSSSAESP